MEAVQKVDGALADISTDVTQVPQLLATMASDNEAQSAAITQISAAIGTMDHSTSLSEMASRFNVGGSGGRSSTLAKASKSTSFQHSAAYTSPIKPLPAAAIAALTPSADDWNSF